MHFSAVPLNNKIKAPLDYKRKMRGRASLTLDVAVLVGIVFAYLSSDSTQG